MLCAYWLPLCHGLQLRRQLDTTTKQYFIRYGRRATREVGAFSGFSQKEYLPDLLAAEQRSTDSFLLSQKKGLAAFQPLDPWRHHIPAFTFHSEAAWSAVWRPHTLSLQAGIANSFA